MDGISSAFDRVAHWCSSRLPWQSAAFAPRHDEFILTDDNGEDVDQLQGFHRSRPPGRSRCKIFLLLLGLLLMFGIGFLVGNASQVKKGPKNSNGGDTNQDTDAEDGLPKFQPSPVIHLSWRNVSQLLKQKLTNKAFDETLPEFDLPQRSTGSEGDVQLGNLIFNSFQKLDMNPWSHTHNVPLPEPDSKRPNRVVFGSTVFEPVGYLAYSPAAQVEGRLVYGNYGRLQDLDIVQKNNIEVNGSVLLLRTGKISFAEQVDNAAARGASAVLIYPDTKDYNYNKDTPLYGHVHLGQGDPYSPGFPSFHHSQLAPIRSSGLPKIPAQTITASNATVLLQNIGGPISTNSSFIGGLKSVTYRLGGQKNITVEVNNILVNKAVRNVFGVIKGSVDSDRAVVLGAQRDAWGKGYTKATVGTSVLVQLARVVRAMVEKDHFRPRRTLVFASWSAGEYGNIGATEWLESYMSSVDRSVYTYISLDGVVMGLGSFVASASPLLYGLLERAMKEVQDPFDAGSLYDMMGKSDWVANVMRPMLMDDPAYPFLAFSGIPSISFRFISKNKTESYTYYGTNLDSRDHLNYNTNQGTSKMAARAAQLAGLMALRLTYTQVLEMDMNQFRRVVGNAVNHVYKRILSLTQSGMLKGVDKGWLSQALGSCMRATMSITTAMVNTDPDNHEACRILNNRIMRIEPALISSYLSPMETPFRHLLWGRGAHTLASIAETRDMEQLCIQLALATSTLHSCASAMARDTWDVEQD